MKAMILETYFTKLIFQMIFVGLCLEKTIVLSDEMNIYNTKEATSDLQWKIYLFGSSQDKGWEEVSSKYGTHDTIRSYQVCDDAFENVNNWIRSPYILTQGGNEIYLEVEFSIKPCEQTLENEQKNTKCKETFNIFFYQADSDVASSTFPPWHENPYVKIDTVAANNVGSINKKSFTFGPLKRSGFYIAIQDQGACMAIISLRAYYYYCSETTVSLVFYPRTISNMGTASLINVPGRCVPNAKNAYATDLMYRCNSNGKWKIQTGICFCDVGFEANRRSTECMRCQQGTYKIFDGPGKCRRCPAHSGHTDSSSPLTTQVDTLSRNSVQCPCQDGFARAPNENSSVPCSEPPSYPTSLTFTKINATDFVLSWKKPEYDGGREDVFYSFICNSSSLSTKLLHWTPCLSHVLFLAPSKGGRYFETSLHLSHLSPYKRYKLLVYAQNGAFSSAIDRNNNCTYSMVEFETDEAVPSTIENVKLINRTSTSITVGWKQPTYPNGLIIIYEVKLIQLNSKIPSKRSDTFETKSPVIEIRKLTENTEYQVNVRARNSAGFGAYSPSLSVNTLSLNISEEQGGESTFMIIIIAVVGSVVFLLVAVMCICRKRKLFCFATTSKKINKKFEIGSTYSDSFLQDRLIDLPPYGQRYYVDYSDPSVGLEKFCIELDPSVIEIEKKIGEGEFSEVWRGKVFFRDQFTDVAIKHLKPETTSTDKLNFFREASTMAQFNHPNVINLIGVVSKHEPISIVTEYLLNGSLDTFLQNNKEKFSIIQLVEMLRGVASGMDYLSSMNYIHRDLAARNILVDSELNCKVSDFGLSRTLENDPHATYMTQGGKIAIRWTAIESILYRKFTTASDVWSYGIVVWEVMSYGEQPYWDMTNEEVVKNIKSGMRLPSPMYCPKPLHDLMVACWSADPALRPTFRFIVQEIDKFLHQPLLLTPALSTHALTVKEAAQILATPNLGRAMDNGEVDTVDKWLEIQHLSKYREQFREKGINSLEKVSNLTISDLEAMNIEVTLHLSKLENGIRTLKRHLSSFISSSPSSSREPSILDEPI